MVQLVRPPYLMGRLKRGSGSFPPYAAPSTIMSGSVFSKDASALTATDASFGSFSLWFNQDQTRDGVLEYLYGGGGNTSPRVGIKILSTGQLQIELRDPTGLISFIFQSVNSYQSYSGWTHVAGSWDVSPTIGAKLGQLYINGISDYALVADAGVGFVVDYTIANNTLAGTGNGTVGSVFKGKMAEFWMDYTTRIDFSVTANLRKFLDANGYPVDVGATGATPLGTQPVLFFRGAGNAFGVNSGNGGTFTRNGTFTANGTTVFVGNDAAAPP